MDFIKSPPFRRIDSSGTTSEEIENEYEDGTVSGYAVQHAIPSGFVSPRPENHQNVPQFANNYYPQEAQQLNNNNYQHEQQYATNNYYHHEPEGATAPLQTQTIAGNKAGHSQNSLEKNYLVFIRCTQLLNSELILLKLSVSPVNYLFNPNDNQIYQIQTQQSEELVPVPVPIQIPQDHSQQIPQFVAQFVQQPIPPPIFQSFPQAILPFLAPNAMNQSENKKFKFWRPFSGIREKFRKFFFGSKLGNKNNNNQNQGTIGKRHFATTFYGRQITCHISLHLF